VKYADNSNLPRDHEVGPTYRYNGPAKKAVFFYKVGPSNYASNAFDQKKPKSKEEQGEKYWANNTNPLV